jgi:hypothetical protein
VDAPSLTSTASDFAAEWAGPPGHPSVVVSYRGADDLAAGARNWQLAVSNGSSPCGSATADPPPVTIDIDKDCVKAGGTFAVGIDFTYFGAPAHFDVPVGGSAPTPVDPADVSFTAAWNADAAAPQVVLSYTGSAAPAELRPLDWTEVVTSSADPGVTCGSATANPAGGDVAVSVDLTACPPVDHGSTAAYRVEIAFTDPDYGKSGDYSYAVSGSPPS